MPPRVVRSRGIDPGKLGAETTITCYIEVESVLSKAALIESGPDGRGARLLGEVDTPTSRFTGPSGSGKYRTVRELSIQPDALDDLISCLLSDLLEESDISSEDVDFISALADGYAGLENHGEALDLAEETADSCRKELGGRPSIIKLGAPKVSANELKSRLVASGSREIIGSENGRSGNLFLDFSTYMSGLSSPPEESSRFIGMVSGLGGEILDALARGSGSLTSEDATTLQLPEDGGKVYEDESQELASLASEMIGIGRVPTGTCRVGKVPVDVEESHRRGVKLIGCDVGNDGSEIGKITDMGRRAASYGAATLEEVIAETFARVIGELVRAMYGEGLIESGSCTCISGRRDLVEGRMERVGTYLREAGFEEIAEGLILVENPEAFGVLKAFPSGSGPVDREID